MNRQNFLWSTFLAVALAAGLSARLIYAPQGASSERERTPDEVMYTTYASVLAHEGLVKGTRIAVDQYNKNPKLQVFPPPTRAGYLYPLALVMRFSGRSDSSVGIVFSRVVSVLSLFLLTFIVWRYFGLLCSVFGALLMSFSPMELIFSRRVWQDGLMTLAGGLILLFGFQLLLSRKKILPAAFFALAGIFAMMVKESGAIFFGLSTLFIGAVFICRRDIKSLTVVTLAASVAVLLVLGLMVWLSGGLSILADTLRHFQQSFAINTYVREDQSGPWHALFSGLFAVSPATLLLAIAGIAAIPLLKDRNEKLLAVSCAFLFVMFIAVLSIPPHLKNLRFLSPVLIPCFILASCLVKKLETNHILLYSGIILFVGIAFLDAATFHRLVMVNHTKDLVPTLLWL